MKKFTLLSVAFVLLSVAFVLLSGNYSLGMEEGEKKDAKYEKFGDMKKQLKQNSNLACFEIYYINATQIEPYSYSIYVGNSDNNIYRWVNFSIIEEKTELGRMDKKYYSPYKNDETKLICFYDDTNKEVGTYSFAEEIEKVKKDSLGLLNKKPQVKMICTSERKTPFFLNRLLNPNGRKYIFVSPNNENLVFCSSDHVDDCVDILNFINRVDK